MGPYKKPIFPITLFQNRIKENNALKKRYLPKIEKLYSDHHIKIPDGWDTGNVYTSFDNDEANSYVFDTNILDLYTDYIKKFFDDYVEFDFVDLWFNCYENGEYQEQHNHLNPDIFNTTVAHFACIHYLKFDSEVHKSAVFIDPLRDLRYTSLEMKSNRYHDKYSPMIEEGDIIMFPNYLDHFVKQSEPTIGNPRVTISFNISIKTYGNLEKR